MCMDVYIDGLWMIHAWNCVCRCVNDQINPFLYAKQCLCYCFLCYCLYAIFVNINIGVIVIRKASKQIYNTLERVMNPYSM